ncbi:cytochrome c oxidase assembly protein [Microbacterium hominis]|uniref:Cytochrome c oxidase assembly protein n=2 Tax=Microbacteriaceae TaxID=85023 RepID=A0A2K9DJQ5_9MICO|nr:cytochrome c oxidase assembly protein [Microbacterium hominis]QOC27311.1 cytochrome c oxidase assembly protein [Microbacterium hominis]QOC30386.1 cytochrome c oxidase assembly protein [Microbacterium hominis]QRY42156.1 cytochrome c oxidase assembly protein [Microbacterium hominis]QYF99416.1 cytochrome c oxidase assembly protein [Microbacterium sp. PAMC21962]
MRRAARRGVAWPAHRAVLFFTLGLGSYAVIELGFLGTWSAELRWAFVARIALLLMAVPGLVSLGRPLDLLRAGLSADGRRRLDAILDGRVFRVLGNAMFATLFVAVVFCVFLTPLAGILRTSPVIGEAIGVVALVIGLLLVVPLMALTGIHTSTFLAVEFLLAFVELVIDSIPGILLRLNDTVVDGVAAATGAGWWPNPLHDQHLAGDLLWFIAEVADVPILIILLVRWGRRDRVEAAGFDALTDEEHDALVQAHLRGDRTADA